MRGFGPVERLAAKNRRKAEIPFDDGPEKTGTNGLLAGCFGGSLQFS